MRTPLRTDTTLWRIAFLSGLGVAPAACHESRAVVTQPPGESVPLPPLGAATPCSDSVPVLEGGFESGLERCSDGRIHRTAAIECSSSVPRTRDAGPTETGDAGPELLCTSDAQCTEKAYGHCSVEGGAGLVGYCQYGCVRDADCGSGFLCQCGDPVGRCVESSCQSDADCGSGLLCARDLRGSDQFCGVVYGFSCESPDDTCRTDEHCPSTRFGSTCATPEGTRECFANSGLICGRPFLVAGSERLAPLARSAAWLDETGLKPHTAGLEDGQRQHLAEAWARLGLMEHASVAAFARFSLQLLQVGAPAALLEQSQRAMADELSHARLCFGIASGYAGKPLGPGPLPIDQALDLTSLEDIAALTLHEGCIGETLAALEASEALALATDPAVRAALEQIQRDERRHAELGWRFVCWAIQTGGASVQVRIQRELSILLRRAAAPPSADASFDTTPHGILPASHRAELRAAALRDVIAPCARALLPMPTKVLSSHERECA